MKEVTFLNREEWAVIIGGSSGLGLASAHKLSSHGMHICIIHRDRKSDIANLEEEISIMKSHGVQVIRYNIDATRSDKCMDTVANIKNSILPKGKIKTIIFSLSRGNLKPMVDAKSILLTEDFAVTIDAMATTLYRWVKAIYAADLFCNDSRILSFTSEGNQRAWQNYAAVSAAKAALEAISRSIALEFAPYGVRSNCVQAGVTQTRSFQMIPNHEQIETHTLKRNPYKRLTLPEDVADVVYLLCRDEASWINGAIIPVDGGERIV